MMKKIWMVSLGALAAAAFVAARFITFATVPMAGTVMFSETSFAGSGRLWVLVACALLAAVFSVLGKLASIAPLFACLGLGMLADIGIAAWNWRSEQMDLLGEMHLQSLEAGIHYGLGGIALAGGGALLAVHVLAALCCRCNSRKQ
jgi:hypothetical protein